MYVCMYVYECVYIHTCTCKQVYKRICTFSRVYVCVSVTDIYMHTPTHTKERLTHFKSHNTCLRAAIRIDGPTRRRKRKRIHKFPTSSVHIRIHTC